jgi:dolichol-phosphate mannosyltransferase
MNFSIIIPVYNEKRHIIKTIANIEKVFKKKSYEIIFVDSSSNDGSKEIFIKLIKKNKKIKVIFQNKKEGIGSASLEGYVNSRGSIIMQIDGDVSHNPKDLLLMYSKLKKDKKDMVIGSRYIAGGQQIGKSLLRDLGSRFINSFASAILGIPHKDFSHTLRVFRRNSFLKVKKNLSQKGHPSFFIELTYLFLKKNFLVCEYPVVYDDSKSDKKSNISIVREVPKYFFTIIKILFTKIR